ncbi:MAG: HAD family hydrolase [Candidatus Gastranaerophilaceae bacterium]
MIKIVIFDMDGTILNTLEDLTDSTNYALSKFHYPNRTIKEVQNFVGNGVAKLIERAIPNGLENTNYNKCLTIFKEHYKNNMYNKTAPYAGIKELLINLKNRGYKTAVVSNKFDLAVKELSDKYFHKLLDVSIGENEALGVKKKPAPDTVFKVLKEFNIKPEEAIYVGDSDVDIVTAKNANMPCISVCWGFRNEDFLLKNGAKILVKTPCDILKYV